MKLDIHTHVFHNKIAEKACTQLIDHYGYPLTADGREKSLIEMMDKAGIDKAVVLSAATNADQVIPANTWAMTLGKKDRFIPFGTIHPDFENWEDELLRLERKGVKGIKIHPEFQGFNLDAEVMFPIYEAIQKRFAVLFHVGDVLPPDKNPSSPQKLRRVMDNFPDLTCIAAHFGGFMHWDWVAESYKGTDIFFDTSSSLKFITDNNLKTILNSFPEEAFLFGSDFPINDPNNEIELLKKKAHFSDDRIERMMEQGMSVFDRLG